MRASVQRALAAGSWLPQEINGVPHSAADVMSWSHAAADVMSWSHAAAGTMRGAAAPPPLQPSSLLASIKQGRALQERRLAAS